MKIAIIGTGYVGLVAGTGFAENGHDVICVDKDPGRIEALRNGVIPIYEPGLEELVVRNAEEERLAFTTDLAEAVSKSLLIFMCVGTPEGEGGRPDMSQVFGAAEEIGRAIDGYRIVVSKSTCPLGTVDELRRIIGGLTEHPFDMVSNPEFLKEGAAVDDFMRPDRIVVGCDDVRVGEIMRELYSPFLRTGKPLLMMDIRSAELAKYASNAMLATRISLMNELATIADVCGADITAVRESLAADSRIGSTYLFPGLGYGGSCLPKDVAAIASLAKDNGVPSHVLDAVGRVNTEQQDRFIQRILDYYGDAIVEKTFAIWGAAFKPRTDDVRCAPALRVIDALLRTGARVTVFDPVATKPLEQQYGDQIVIAHKMYDALAEADGLVIATEWRGFHGPDFERMGNLMREKVIFDGRNLYSVQTMEKMAFRYFSIGRPSV